MASAQNSYIPIWVTSTPGYNKPQVKDGRLTISASASKMPANSLVFYDINKHTYAPIDTNSASFDYVVKAYLQQAKYRQIQAQQQTNNYVADTYNPSQINSFADVFANFSHNYNPLAIIPRTIQGFAQDGIKGAATNWWNNSIFNALGTAARQTAGLIKDYTIDPLQSNMDATQKSLTLLQNTLTNFGETIDYFTLANPVKGLLQEGPKGVQKALGVDGQRWQYDWNTGLGKLPVALPMLGKVSTVDLGLELLSDPTNWFTFGSSAAIKSLSKESVGEILTKSMTESGLEFTEDGLRRSVKSVIKMQLQNNDDIVTALLKTDISPYVKNLSKDKALDLVRKINKNSVIAAESKNYRIINSLTSSRNALDELQKLATKASALTAPTTVVYAPLLAAQKLAPHAMPYVKSVVSRLGNEVDLNNVPHANVDTTINGIADTYKTMGEVYNAVDNGTPAEVLRVTSRVVQERTYKTLDNVFNQPINTASRLKAVDSWAKLNGYSDIFQYYNKLRDYPSVIPDTQLAIAHKVKTHLEGLYNDAHIEVLNSIKELMGVNIEDVTDVATANKLIQSLQHIIITKGTTFPLGELLHIDEYRAIKDALHNVAPYWQAKQMYDVAISNLDLFAVNFDNLDMLSANKLITAIQDSNLAPIIGENNIRAALKAIDEWNEGLTDNILINSLYNQLNTLVWTLYKDSAEVLKRTNINPKMVEQADALMKTIYDRLDNTIDVIRSNKIQSDVNIIPQDAIAKMMHTNSGNPVYEYLQDAATKQGKAVDEAVISNLTDVSNAVLDINEHYSTNLLNIAIDIRDTLEHSKVVTWLDDYLDEWDNVGLSKPLGEQLLKELDNITTHINTELKGSAWAAETLGKIVKLYRNLEKVLTYAEQETAFTKTQLKSRLYVNKLAHVESFKQILETPGLLKTMQDIKDVQGIGTVLGMVNTTDSVFEDSPIVPLVKKLVADSESFNIGRQLIDLIEQDKTMSKEFKDALLDVVSGKQRNTVQIYNPTNYASTIAMETKVYLDYSTNKHVNLYERIGINKRTDTQDIVNALRNYTDQLNIKKYDGKDAVFIEQNLANTGDFVNVPYAIAHTGNKTGSFFEITLVNHEGELVTIVNKDYNVATITEAAAWSLYGMGRDALVKARETLNRENVIECSASEFPAKIKEVLQPIKDYGYKVRKPIRLMGYNNAMDGLASDKILNDFFRTNSLNFNLVYDRLADSKATLNMFSIDLGQAIRAVEQGAFVVPDTYYTALTDIFTTIKAELDSVNSYHTNDLNIKIGMMPNINAKTIDALNTLSLMLEEVIAQTPRLLTTEQLATLSQLNRRWLAATKYNLDDLRFSLSKTFTTISKSNKELASTILIRNGLKDIAGTSNIMYMLRDMLETDGILPLSAKVIYDPQVMKDWVLDDLTNKADVLRTYNTVAKFEDRLNYITQPQLLTGLNEDDVKDIVATLREDMFKRIPNAGSIYKDMYYRLGAGRDQLHSYILAKHYFDRVSNRMNAEEFNTYFKQLLNKFHDNPFLYFLRNPDETVYTRASVYVPDVNALNSALFQTDATLIEGYNLYQDSRAIAKQTGTLTQTMMVEDRLARATKYYLGTEQRKVNLLKPFARLVNNVQAALTDIKHGYEQALKDNTYDNFLATQEYTKAVQGVLDDINTLGTAHALHRANQTLSMDAITYRNYLFKYSTGVQVIDLNAEMFKNGGVRMLETLKKFMTMLDSAEAQVAGLRYALRDETSELFTWVDKQTVLDNEDMFKEIAENFSITTDVFKLADDANSMFYDDYHALAEHLYTKVDPAYGLSMHTIMTERKRAALLDYIPAEVKDGALDSAYYLDNHMFDNLFNHTVLGDYGAGAGYIYTAQSTNMFTNIASGFNAVYNTYNSIDAYASYLRSPDASLKSYLNNAKAFGIRVDHKDVVDAIKRNNRLVVVIDDTRIRAINISTKRGFQYALDNNAALIDYALYNRAQEVINKGRVSSKLMQWLNKNYLVPLKIGMLLSPGFIMRNMIDSTLKGVLQAGDVEYVTSLFRTQQIRAKFYATLFQLYDETDGIINRESIKEFFVKHPNDANLLNEDLFGRVFAFSNTSSASASKYDMLRKNNLDKLYRYVEGSEEITKAMVMKAIGIFDTLEKNAPVAVAKAELDKVFPPNIADTLAPLIMYFTKEDKSLFETTMGWKYNPLHYIEETSTSFEEFIRLHTFLYWSEYRGGTFSEGIKMTDLSQFNRAHDSDARKLLDTIMPFTSFAIDNVQYWADLISRKSNIIAVLEDISSAAYDPEQFDAEEVQRNKSLQWMLMQGNTVLDESTGMTLKTGNSLYNAIEFMANPVQTLADSWHVGFDVLKNLSDAINADNSVGIAQYTKDSYNNTKPISMWNVEDWTDEMVQLIPVIGTLWTRYTSAQDKRSWSDELAPLILPDMFGVTKMDSAGTTYESRPIGYNWYNQPQAYKDTHRFVFGVSYVPTWMTHDPATYVNTYGRLVAMGYTNDQVSEMMNDGWYIDYKSYELKNRNNAQYHRTYARRTYAKRYYSKRVYAKRTKKVRSVRSLNIRDTKTYAINLRRNNLSMYPAAYRNVKYFGRRNLYKDNYAKYGATRMAMRIYAGANASAIKLARQTMQQRQRQQYRRF